MLSFFRLPRRSLGEGGCFRDYILVCASLCMSAAKNSRAVLGALWAGGREKLMGSDDFATRRHANGNDHG